MLDGNIKIELYLIFSHNNRFIKNILIDNTYYQLMFMQYPCQICGKLIKCNAKNIGAKKIQLQQHEKSCAKLNGKELPDCDYKLTQEDIDKFQKKRCKPKTPAVVKMKEYNSFEELDYIYMWDAGYDIWQPYSLPTQIILNNNHGSKKQEILIYEYKYSSRLDYSIKLEIRIHLKNLTQIVLKRNEKLTYYTKANARSIKCIKNTTEQYRTQSKLGFYDPLQNCQYRFNRESILESYKSEEINFYSNKDNISLISLIPYNVKIINILKVNNSKQHQDFMNSMIELYSHVDFDFGRNKFNVIANKTLEELSKKIIGFHSATNKSNGIVPNDEIVFHGCYDNMYINSICENSFNPFLCNTALYGYGSYFSKTFEYCDKNGYSADLGENIYHLFICRLATGSYCVGKSNQRVPSLLTQTTRCKTMVDTIENPKIYSVQDPRQIEILYEIHYTKNDNVHKYFYNKMHV